MTIYYRPGGGYESTERECGCAGEVCDCLCHRDGGECRVTSRSGLTEGCES